MSEISYWKLLSGHNDSTADTAYTLSQAKNSWSSLSQQNAYVNRIYECPSTIPQTVSADTWTNIPVDGPDNSLSIDKGYFVEEKFYETGWNFTKLQAVVEKLGGSIGSNNFAEWINGSTQHPTFDSAPSSKTIGGFDCVLNASTTNSVVLKTPSISSGLYGDIYLRADNITISELFPYNSETNYMFLELKFNGNFIKIAVYLSHTEGGFVYLKFVPQAVAD